MASHESKMSPEAIRNGTGKHWDEWVKILDGANATSMDHATIAKYIHENFEVSGWWAQGVAIGYEHEKGMHPAGMTSDGFAAHASKTLPIPVEHLWRLWADDELRAQWLDLDLITKTTATENKSFHGKWNADDSRVSVHFSAKGESKSSFGVQHKRLSGQEEIVAKKAFWKDAIQRLVEVAETQGWL